MPRDWAHELAGDMSPDGQVLITDEEVLLVSGCGLTARDVLYVVAHVVLVRAGVRNPCASRGRIQLLAESMGLLAPSLNASACPDPAAP